MVTHTNPSPSSTLLKPSRPVGIVGYGAYVPRYRLPAREVARIWTGEQAVLPIKEKAVPGLAMSSTALKPMIAAPA